MEVRKNKLKDILDIGYWRKKKSLSIIVSCWLLVFSMLAQPILAATVEVRIEGPTKNIYQGIVNTTQTTITASDGSQTTIGANKAATALEEAAKMGGFTTSYDNTIYGLFLTTIAGIKNKADWSKTWGIRHNYQIANEGVSSLSISDGDKLLFFYSPWPYYNPLKISVSKQLLKRGEQFIITTTYYNDTDATFKPIGASVFINNQILQTNNQGTLTTSISDSGDYKIYASKNGFIRSNRINISIESNTPPQNQLPDKAASNNDLQISKNPITNKQISNSLKKALRYLKIRQSKSGKIENPSVSAWAAIAFAAADINPNSVMKRKRIPRKKRSSLMDYLKRYSQKNLNRKWLKKHKKAARPLATDYARQIMAIYAAGHNPYNFAGINHVKELSRFFRKNQFGSKALLNDDIFAIIAYRAGQVSAKNHRYRKAIEFVLKNQKDDGGFSYSTNPSSTSDIDTTAAAIQALVIAKKSGVKNLDVAIQKAYGYLTSKQNKDGGFPYNSQFNSSSSQSTSWAIQAITSWKGTQALDNLTALSGLNPVFYLLQLQQSDGGFGYTISNTSNVWATATTIPALAKRSWLIKWRRRLSINSNRKKIRRSKIIRIFGKASPLLNSRLILRYKRGRENWRTLRRIKLNSNRTYSARVKITSNTRYVFAVRSGAYTSHNMIIYGK